MNRATKFWQEYRLKVYETDEPLVQTQERECSLAFYAGMIASFAEMSQISVNAKDEDSGAHEMEVFRQEIDRAAAWENLNRSKGNN